MPFNIQTKGLLIGLVIGALVVPRVQGFLQARSK